MWVQVPESIANGSCSLKICPPVLYIELRRRDLAGGPVVWGCFGCRGLAGDLVFQQLQEFSLFSQALDNVYHKRRLLSAVMILLATC